MTASAGSWEIAHPRAPLPGVVNATGYRSTGETPGVHRGIPSPYLTFIVSVDGPIVASWDRAEVTEGRVSGTPTVVGGLHTAPAYVERPATEAGVQLAVHPLAARAVFGLPAAELVGQTLTAEDVWGAATAEVEERVHECKDWEARFAVLRDALAARMGDHAERARDDVVEAWRLLSSTGGNATVTEVAAHVQLGNRQLTDVFRREVGLSPKRVGRLMRYHSVVRRLSGPTSKDSLADVAAEHGYADQAHLTRDFVEFTGIPPTRWLAEELRFVQDSGEEAGAFWEA